MKVCVPSMGERGLEEAVGEHFGRVPFYTLYDTESKTTETFPNTSNHMGGTLYPPELIAQAGADVMVCRGLGGRAVQLFQEAGIMVYVGAGGTVKNALDQWKSGVLEQATDENACKQHAHHGEGEGHGDGHHHQH